MLTRLYRLLLAVICCPLLGAFGLRWALVFIVEVLTALGIATGSWAAFADVIGSFAGLVLGVIYATGLARNAFEPGVSPVRGPADALLITLALTLLVNLGVSHWAAATVIAPFVAPATLIIWFGTAAANLQLTSARRQWRKAYALPQPLPPPPAAPVA